VECVASGADVDHRHAPDVQAFDGVATQQGTDTTTLRRGVHGDHLEATGVTLRDVPSDVAEYLSLLLCEGDEPIAGGVVECRNLPAILVLPVCVSVGEDLRAERMSCSSRPR
jgi:hypothetical protein